MLEQVRSGGQSGADIGALKAARAWGLPTGGWAPRGWLMEGPAGQGHAAAPWLGVGFGLRECPEGESPAQRYAIRRRWNVRDSDGTLLFFRDWTPGTKGVWKDLKAEQKPVCVVARPELFEELCGVIEDDEVDQGRIWLARSAEPASTALWVNRKAIRMLNVAGPRGSTAPKMEAFAYDFLTAVFAVTNHKPTAAAVRITGA